MQGTRGGYSAVKLNGYPMAMIRRVSHREFSGQLTLGLFYTPHKSFGSFELKFPTEKGISALTQVPDAHLNKDVAACQDFKCLHQ